MNATTSGAIQTAPTTKNWRNKTILDTLSNLFRQSTRGNVGYLDEEGFQLFNISWDTYSLNCTIEYRDPKTHEKMCTICPNLNRALEETLPKLLEIL